MQIDWNAVSAIGTAISTLLVLLSFLFLAEQIREARRATIGQSFLGIVGIVQSQEMREARRRVFGLSGKPLEQWNDSEIGDVERVCQSYDIYGMLCRYKLIPTRIVVDSWGDSIMRTWEVCSPYVVKLREQREAPEFWDDLEWLYKKAKSFRWHRYLFRKRHVRTTRAGSA